MAKSLGVVVAVAVGATLLLAGGWRAEAADLVILRSGRYLAGDLQETEFTLYTPQASYRATRANTARLVLGTAAGDTVELRNGDRISGRVDQSRYTLRLPGGETRVVERAEASVVVLGASSPVRGERVPDVLLLRTGDFVYGELVGPEFELTTDAGRQRLDRSRVWRIILGSARGDLVELQNGERLLGLVDRPTYAIRTSDGQNETYGREEVLEVLFRPPERPRAGAGGTGDAAGQAGTAGAGAGTQVAAAPPTTVPTPSLPPQVRAALRDLHFEFDSWQLTPEARRTLEDLATAMKAFPSLTLLIEGHADERGTAEYNLALAARRAEAAKDYLVNLGIETSRLDMISYGEERPLDAGHNEIAWSLNRRAHFAVKAP